MLIRRAVLAPGEGGLPFLQDRLDRFAAVLAGESAPRQLQLVAQVTLEVFEETGPGHQALGLPRSERRDLCDLAAVRAEGLLELVPVGGADLEAVEERRAALKLEVGDLSMRAEALRQERGELEALVQAMREDLDAAINLLNSAQSRIPQ